MKRVFHRSLFLIFIFACLVSYSQDLTGIWRGYFTTESSDQYKFELQIQQKGNYISGVSYSYLSTVFYGKATLTGSFNKSAQSALIQEIKTVEVKMSGGSNACIMKCVFQFNTSGKEQFLEGVFSSKFEKNGYGAAKGGDCGGGKVFLRKVTTSDFYIEPFLRNKMAKDSSVTKNKPVITQKPATTNKTVVKKNPPVVTKEPAAKNTIAKSITKKSVITTPKNKVVTTKPSLNTKVSATKKPATKPNSNNNLTKINTPLKEIEDSNKKIEVVPAENLKKEVISIPDVLKTRENALVKTLIVTSTDITIRVYDNGVVDGDTISVYMDKKLVLHNRGLSESPIIYKFKMDENNDEHELVMVAENLGRIPPNTSLMIVEAGDQQFSVHITSTEQKNAVIRFKYQKPK